MMSRVKLVVIDEHTLGYLIPKTGKYKYAGIIWPSVLKGSPWNALTGSVLVEYSDVRLASAKDFEEFNVSFKGFDNEAEYEFKKD